MAKPPDDIITRFADEMLSRLLAAIGEQHVLCVFVGGSVAGGDELFSRVGDIIEFYSDLDLYIVVNDSVDLEEAKRRGRSCVAEIPLEGPGFRFCRGPDVGVYTRDDLASQPARPGTVGLDRRHRLLYGDGDVAARAAERIGTRIAPAEALYLLENRLTELAVFQLERGGVPGDGNDRHYAFEVCKTALDVATASYVVRGQYDPRRSERLRMLETLSRDTGADPGWTTEALDLVQRCGERIQRMPAPDWSSGFAPASTADDVVSLALDRWRLIAAMCLNADPDDWSDLVLKRCRTGDYLGNFRQFRAMNIRCGFKRRRAVMAGVHLSRYSPVDALRLSALMDFLSRSATSRPDVARLASTLGPFLDRLTGECGFSTGSVVERAFDMHRAVK